MNQIIQTPNNSIPNHTSQFSDSICEHCSLHAPLLDKPIIKKKRSLLFLKIYYFSSIFAALFFSIYYFYGLFNMSRDENLSQVILGNYDISRLYTATSSSPLTHSISLDDEDSFSVIGILQIDKIDLRYPILSDINDRLLQVSPCRFDGPLPNEPRQLMYCSP